MPENNNNNSSEKRSFRKLTKHVSIGNVPVITTSTQQIVDDNGVPTGKYRTVNMSDTSKGVNKYNAVALRFNAAYEALRQKNISIEDSKRLARLITQQSIAESGWTLGNKENNLGGHLIPGTHTKIKFNSVPSFFNSHINNLDSKFGDTNINGNWRNSKNIKSFINSINAGDKFKTKSVFDKAQKEAKKNNKTLYLYNPAWDNNGVPYGKALYDVHSSVNGVIDMLLQNNLYSYNTNNRRSLENVTEMLV